jgi:hypothetical protein
VLVLVSASVESTIENLTIGGVVLIAENPNFSFLTVELDYL